MPRAWMGLCFNTSSVTSQSFLSFDVKRTRCEASLKFPLYHSSPAAMALFCPSFRQLSDGCPPLSTLNDLIQPDPTRRSTSCHDVRKSTAVKRRRVRSQFARAATIEFSGFLPPLPPSSEYDTIAQSPSYPNPVAHMDSSPSPAPSPASDSGSDYSEKKSSSSQKKKSGTLPQKYTETREERLAKNRVSAAKSRKKKKAWIDNLSGKVEQLTNENIKLKTIVDNLRYERDVMRQDLSAKLTQCQHHTHTCPDCQQQQHEY
ncbi:hypothetical protein BT69DRAFT_746024 [Atractiella rhizophila]|nr:hypothetical protein BT69DRAFT_746024 [Atractiella rhizophila]